MRRPVVLVVVVGVLVIALVAGIAASVLVSASRSAAPTRSPAVEATWPAPARIAWKPCSGDELRSSSRAGTGSTKWLRT